MHRFQRVPARAEIIRNAAVFAEGYLSFASRLNRFQIVRSRCRFSLRYFANCMVLPSASRISFAPDDELEAVSVFLQQRVRFFHLAVAETKDVQKVEVTEFQHSALREIGRAH